MAPLAAGEGHQGRTAESPASTADVEESWYADNDRYLTAALHWLRLLLRRYIETTCESTDGVAATDPAAPSVTAAQLEAAEQEMKQAAQSQPPPALMRLSRVLGLSPFERNTLLLCVGQELDSSLAELCTRAQGRGAASGPTFALAFVLFSDPAWDILSPYRGLRFWRLVEIGRSAEQALVSSPLRADERIVNHVKGLDYVDDRLELLLTPLPSNNDPDGLPPSHQCAVREITSCWRMSPTGKSERAPVIQLIGTDRESKESVAARAAGELGLLLYTLPAGLLPEPGAELDAMAKLWHREALLLPVALYLDADDGELIGGEERENARRIGQFLRRSGGPCFVATREHRPEVPAPTHGMDIAPPPMGERTSVWGRTFAPGEADRLAGQFALSLSTIEEVVASSGADPTAAWRSCLARTRPRLGALAQRMEPRAGWDDIVLPPEESALLRQIGDQVAQRCTVYRNWGFGERENRGLGISALFTGPSGTGKTMAAEVLARHLEIDLYRVDLSATVSKYIGETEKNLRRLFDAAEPGGAILFFDEADSLFGKRSQVNDSHDRYANIEVSYLLQRMEAYQGLAILATNLRRSLDTAFLRRLRFIVPFAFPDARERREIWARALPAAAPTEPLDLDRLAGLPLSGGMIRNTAVNAAFAAASAGTAIGMAELLTAARTELRKMEMPVNERDFVWNDQGLVNP
ncbi:AAA family ATPase [Streptomyces sp. NPDC002265]|uniref:ATP-binding protein n=1 Tax=Streptomyces sp. NPDC002265 TaxID=3154415 RepID=UPI00333070C9